MNGPLSAICSGFVREENVVFPSWIFAIRFFLRFLFLSLFVHSIIVRSCRLVRVCLLSPIKRVFLLLSFQNYQNRKTRFGYFTAFDRIFDSRQEVNLPNLEIN